MSYKQLTQLLQIKQDALDRGDQETADKAQGFILSLSEELETPAENTKG